MDLEYARSQMVEQQIRAFAVLDQRVLDLFREVPRERFVPEAYEHLAFADTAIPLPHGQVMMTPTVEGRMLQALDVGEDEAVLDVGTGSGFSAACLAHLGGRVTSVDIHEDLSHAARTRIHDLGYADVACETWDASRLTDREAYDVIAVTGSLPVMEESFLEALRIAGRLFVIVGEAPVMQARLYTRVAEQEWSEEFLFETLVPPLEGARRASRFTF